MTFNLRVDIALGGHKHTEQQAVYDEATKFVDTMCKGRVVFSSENWFGGKYGGTVIRALGFETEADRALFVLAFAGRLTPLTATDMDFAWGHDDRDPYW